MINQTAQITSLLLLTAAATTVASPIQGYTHYRNPPTEKSRRLDDMSQLAAHAERRGDSLMKSGNLKAAVEAYQESVKVYPQGGYSYQKIAECEALLGDWTASVTAYWTLLYPSQLMYGTGHSQQGDPFVWLSFAEALAQTGNADESTQAYRAGVKLLSEQHNLKLPLPDIGSNQGQVTYTVQRLTALAEVGKGITCGDPNDRKRYFDNATTVDPSLAISYFYIGDTEKGLTGHAATAIAAFNDALRCDSSADMRQAIEAEKHTGSGDFRAAIR